MADLHQVLTVCGVQDQNVRQQIIDGKGFAALEDIAILEGDADVTEMAKRMAARPAANNRVFLATTVIKKIQGLVWWVRDQRKLNQDIDPVLFTPAMLAESMKKKRIQKELSGATDASASELPKFDPDDYDTHEDAFLNFLSRSYGVQNESLRYVVRPDEVPAEFVNDAEERMFSIPLEGAAFDTDNVTVYHKLKAFLIDTAGWTWIEPFNSTQDGHGAFWAWENHYNGQGELRKRTQMKLKIKAMSSESKASAYIVGSLPFIVFALIFMIALGIGSGGRLSRRS